VWVAAQEEIMVVTVNRLDGAIVGREKRPGLYGDGAGLYLAVSSPTAKSWLFRYRRGGKTHYMGLGSVKTFGLAEARERARRQRQLLADGLDPIKEREKTRLAVELGAARAVTFEKCAADYLKQHSPGWTNAKHGAQWASTLKQYCYPVFGSFPVQDVDTRLVTKALTRIWQERPVTAGRVRGRIEAVLQWATKAGHRTGDNPAALSALPLPPLAHKVRHMPALSYQELPDFMTELQREDGVSARALELLILCASRSSEVLRARWDEIDVDGKLWLIPSERMKAKRPHRVPLSSRAFEVIEGQCGRDPVYVFPGSRPGHPLTHTTLLTLLQHMGRGHVVPHGFRATFKTWAREQSNFANEIIEAALAHAPGDKLEQAYLRGDALAKRARLMEAWSRYCGSGKDLRGEVVPIRNQ
jgi:integrase